MDEIMHSMADSEARCQEAGLKLLALLSAKSQETNILNEIFPPQHGPRVEVGLSGEEAIRLIAATSRSLPPPPMRRYERDFLFYCSDSTASRSMPRGLKEKLDEFPVIKRKKIGNFSRGHDNKENFATGGAEGEHFGPTRQGNVSQRGRGAKNSGDPFDLKSSILDSLPLIPTAQIFTWDPAVGLWVPRDRPTEA